MVKRMLHFPLLFTLLLVSFFCLPEKLSAGESSTYDFSWLDQDKEVYVLQNRKFRKRGKVFLHVGGGMTTSGSFVDAYAAQVRATHFFMEDWGMEFLYAKTESTENSSAKSVRNNGGGSGSVPFRRMVNSYMGGMVIWSPFYAKVNTFNKIVYLDWLLGVGLAKLEETNNREELIGTLNPQFQTESHTALIWGTGLKFFINRSFDVRMDLTVMHYQAQKAISTATSSDKTFYANYDLSLALGYSF
ncbi:MAG: outer membrane beta-barrel domain-containing protein [Bdellovibrionales bacterium]|jgi:outer membrane beta-barrel protein|nr:outer membrane beta-barrel domain-containing protein [Bdellovibrionales bacterium]MBT3527128.1 outer membrane beta-barrel domain-containing protein [Bdellovibrionales bacterium]MBT7668107.1 outer membrane beta-barrel domain-containing protein [Bdellovibrionales bacterium]MBT7766161.1 outer membrane beta-barrel domain-containing protein [Bdellovibrionales bacterium]